MVLHARYADECAAASLEEGLPAADADLLGGLQAVVQKARRGHGHPAQAAPREGRQTLVDEGPEPLARTELRLKAQGRSLRRPAEGPEQRLGGAPAIVLVAAPVALGVALGDAVEGDQQMLRVDARLLHRPNRHVGLRRHEPGIVRGEQQPVVLFDLLDFSLPDREALADGFLDWTDEDNERRLNGFDGEDYEDFDPPYRPANGPVETFDEFRLIRPFDELFFDENGNPLPVWNTFRESVSLYNEGPVNINAAPPLVLRFLSEKGLIDPYGLDRYKSGTDGEPGTEDDRLIRGGDEGILLEGAAEYASTEVSLLRVKSIASRGQARFEVEVLVEWVGASPGLGTGTDRNRNAEENGERENPPSPRDIRRRSGRARSGSDVRTELPNASDLGYPFKVLRLLENRKF